MKLEKASEFFRKNKYRICLGLLGLIAAILMLTIGFFRTLLIVVLTALLFGYGYLIDRFGFSGANGVIAEFFKKLFSRK